MIEIINKLSSLDETIERVEMTMCKIMLVGMVLVVGLSVFLRYVFKSPMIAAMNIATLLLVWLTFFGASTIYKKRENIQLVFLLKKLPEKMQKTVNCSVLLLIGISICWIVVMTVKLMKLQWTQQIVALNIPRSFLSLPVVFSGCSIALTTFKHILIELTHSEDVLGGK